MSFNIFGLHILFFSGALLIVLSFSIESILSCLHRRRRYNQYKYLEWMSNESLQLHRLAHEGVGWGTWSRATEDIPVTKKGRDPWVPRSYRATPPAIMSSLLQFRM